MKRRSGKKNTRKLNTEHIDKKQIKGKHDVKKECRKTQRVQDTIKYKLLLRIGFFELWTKYFHSKKFPLKKENTTKTIEKKETNKQYFFWNMKRNQKSKRKKYDSNDKKIYRRTQKLFIKIGFSHKKWVKNIAWL